MPSQPLDQYLQLRAEAEVRMAENANCEGAVKAHYELAELYLERLSALSRHGAQVVAEAGAHEPTPASLLRS